MTARRWLNTARQALSIRAHTMYSPTPSLVSQHLSTIPAEWTSVFLLSNSIPVEFLEQLLLIINDQCPSSIGTFSASPPQIEPCISIATFSGPSRGSSAGDASGIGKDRTDAPLKTFHTPMSGRADPEVGRWQRPREVQNEDLKGMRVGEMGSVGGQEGWAGIWKPEEGIERIPELEGSTSVFPPHSSTCSQNVRAAQ